VKVFHQNTLSRMERSRTVARMSSIGGFTFVRGLNICAGGLDIHI